MYAYFENKPKMCFCSKVCLQANEKEWIELYLEQKQKAMESKEWLSVSVRLFKTEIVFLKGLIQGLKKEHAVRIKTKMMEACVDILETTREYANNNECNQQHYLDMANGIKTNMNRYEFWIELFAI